MNFDLELEYEYEKHMNIYIHIIYVDTLIQYIYTHNLHYIYVLYTQIEV